MEMLIIFAIALAVVIVGIGYATSKEDRLHSYKPPKRHKEPPLPQANPVPTIQRKPLAEPAPKPAAKSKPAPKPAAKPKAAPKPRVKAKATTAKKAPTKKPAAKK